jgi:hypothetical protein
MTVTVLGCGRMAIAIRQTLHNRCIQTNYNEDDLQPNIIVSFFSGLDTYSFIEKSNFLDGSVLVDLTTQSVEAALRSSELAKIKGICYLAGGVTGGIREVGSPRFVMLLGSLIKPSDSPPWLHLLGSIHIYDTIEKAVRAKLLHNLYLVVSSQILGTVMQLADKYGIEDIHAVLDKGTAGRLITHHSVVRDYLNTPSSTYTSELASKDIDAIIRSFSEGLNGDWLDLERLKDLHFSAGQQPYTCLTTGKAGSSTSLAAIPSNGDRTSRILYSRHLQAAKASTLHVDSIKKRCTGKNDPLTQERACAGYAKYDPYGYLRIVETLSEDGFYPLGHGEPLAFYDPPVLLSEKDQLEYSQALNDIRLDQSKFFENILSERGISHDLL